MKNCKKLLCLALALVLLLDALPIVAAASPMPFTDVPLSHWAYENIATMSQGNLIKGYGDGQFGPDDQFNIDQMAQMICNVQGYNTNTYTEYVGTKLRPGDQTYWAYGAVNRCRNGGYLPDFGEITAENYAVPCTRELAVYMIVKGLGYNSAVNNPFRAGKTTLTWKDVPDFASCTVEYADAIDMAYQLELVQGVDETGRFNPKGKMTRAEAATMLLNAGWTEAQETPELGEGPSTDELYERIQQLGGWNESQRSIFLGQAPKFELENADRDNSGIIKVSIGGSDGGEYIHIVMDEDNRHTDNADWYQGSAYSYAGRMRLKEILQTVYPDQADFDQAWESVKQAFLQAAYDDGQYTGFNLWIGHRCITGGTSAAGTYKMGISIYNPNYVAPYCGRPPLTDQVYPYRFLGKTAEEAYAGFEFDRW